MVHIPDANQWYTGTVLRGDQVGRSLDFPTINFDPTLLQQVTKEGVYASLATVSGQRYAGALYLGPRITLGETKRVLEIHLLDFSGDLYDQKVSFTTKQFIRPPQDFADEAELRARLQADAQAVRDLDLLRSAG